MGGGWRWIVWWWWITDAVEGVWQQRGRQHRREHSCVRNAFYEEPLPLDTDLTLTQPLVESTEDLVPSMVFNGTVFVRTNLSSSAIMLASRDTGAEIHSRMKDGFLEAQLPGPLYTDKLISPVDQADSHRTRHGIHGVAAGG